jgi:hypothetical protein
VLVLVVVFEYIVNVAPEVAVVVAAAAADDDDDDDVDDVDILL